MYQKNPLSQTCLGPTREHSLLEKLFVPVLQPPETEEDRLSIRDNVKLAEVRFKLVLEFCVVYECYSNFVNLQLQFIMLTFLIYVMYCVCLAEFW